MARNYYLVLGISPDATPEQIREAYHRLARSTHPDVSGADTSARFQEVQEAWETLSDEARRRSYDAALRRSQRPAAREPPASADADLTGAWQGDALHFGLEMTPEEAARGGEMPLAVPVALPCAACGGAGHHFLFLCPACRGDGYRAAWQTVPFRVPAGLQPGGLLVLSLAGFGWPRRRMILHVDIRPD